MKKMGKICAVPGCQSGRNSERMKRKSEGLRQLTLFSIPKNEERREEWKKILDCDLDATQRVCQLHFPPESIIKSDKTRLPDGSVHEMARNLWYLESFALPTAKIYPALDKDTNAAENVKKKVDTAAMPGNSATELSSVALGQKDSRMDESETSVACFSGSGDESSEEINWEEGRESEIGFTMDILKSQLGGAILPESWAWTRFSSGIVFTFLDRCNFQPRLHLEVALDLSMRIRTCTDTVIPLNDTATSIEDIRAYLETLKSRSICTGSGIEIESRDSRCMGILDDDEAYARQQRNPRCLLCRSLRKKLQKYTYRNGHTKVIRKNSPTGQKSSVTASESMKENMDES